MSQTPAHRSSQPSTFEEWVNQNPEVQYFTEQQQRKAYQRYLESLSANIPSFEEWLEKNPALQYFSQEKQREAYKKAFPNAIEGEFPIQTHLKQNKNSGLGKLLFLSLVFVFGLVILVSNQYLKTQLLRLGLNVPIVKNLIKSTIFTNNVKLKSSFGMDYTKLRDLLDAEKWQEADEETSKVIEDITKRKTLKQKLSLMLHPDINEIPCEDLHIIDELWVKYSYGNFGFSVQKEIFQAEKSKETPYYTNDDWNSFQKKVGWIEIKRVHRYLGERYVTEYKDITFNINAPKGHLPFDVWTLVINDIPLNKDWVLDAYNKYKQGFKRMYGSTREPETLKNFEATETRKDRSHIPYQGWVQLAWEPIVPYGGEDIGDSGRTNQIPKDRDNCRL